LYFCVKNKFDLNIKIHSKEPKQYFVVGRFYVTRSTVPAADCLVDAAHMVMRNGSLVPVAGDGCCCETRRWIHSSFDACCCRRQKKAASRSHQRLTVDRSLASRG